MSNAHVTRMMVTINNPDEKNYADLRALCAGARHAVCANERGAEGTPHIQAYVALTRNNKKRLAGWRKALPGAHLEICTEAERYGSDYCKKGDQPHQEWKDLKTEGPTYGLNKDVWLEVGICDHRGLDSSLAVVARAIADRDTSVHEVAMEFPETFVRYHRGLYALEAECVEPRSDETAKEVIVWVGPTGCGKSRIARQRTENAYVWGPEQEKWFSSYRYQKHVILDEFRGSGQMPFAMLYRLLDRYGMRVQVKGGEREFVADVIHITTPLHPSDWYDESEMKVGDSIDQLYRRITKINIFDVVNEVWRLDA